MAAQNEPLFFQQARAAGKVVVAEPPKLDLEAYIANYRGKTRIFRLYHIGSTSSYLYSEALKAAVAEAKLGEDVQLYKTCVNRLREIVPEDPDAALDTEWIVSTTQAVKAETIRLEQELKGYKNNLIKESIRMGQDDLGCYYYAIGLLQEAAKAYAKERDFCLMPQHISIMHMRLIQLYIDQGSWLSVESNVQKLRHLSQKPSDAEKLAPKLAAASGLAALTTLKFRDAADAFLSVDPSLITATAPEDLYKEIITSNDIATYGGICALASMDREELQRLVLENASFRNFLELEPHLRRAISAFVAGKFDICLSILESYKPDYLLDLHLHRHVGDLYARIRSKAIVQYFIPFSCVTLAALGKAFNSEEDDILTQLLDMINRGDLDGRIDLEKRVLLAREVDNRARVQQETLESAKEYARTAHLRILRMEILNAGLEVRAPKEERTSQGSAGNIMATRKNSGGLGDSFAPERNRKGPKGLK